MQVYIYRHLLNLKSIDDFNRKSALQYNIHQHLEYLNDFIELFKGIETDNPNDADYFFIPLFILAFQFANHDPLYLINSCNYLNSGRHLILSTGDFGQRKRSNTELNIPGRAYSDIYDWLDDRFIILALESTIDLLHQDQAFLPYITKDLPNKDSLSKRFLINFVGQVKYPLLPASHIRGETFNNSVQGKFSGNPIGSLHELNNKFNVINDYSFYMRNSLFTLCPAGYGRWTFRFIEALCHGSIPILISDGYVLPFSHIINWDDYLYIVQENDMPNIEYIIHDLNIGNVYSKLNAIYDNNHFFNKFNVLEMTIKTLNSKVIDL